MCRFVTANAGKQQEAVPEGMQDAAGKSATSG